MTRTDGSQSLSASAADDADLVARMLACNVIDETWGICYLANLFVFPVYTRFERDHDILRPEFVTLFCLRHHEPLIAQDIVAMTGLPKNTVSRGVKRLIAKGFVARADHPDDRRKARIHLTDAGHALLDDLLPQVTTRHARLVGVLSDSERKELNRMLLKLADGAPARLDGAGLA